jgi:hypothetical protein
MFYSFKDMGFYIGDSCGKGKIDDGIDIEQHIKSLSKDDMIVCLLARISHQLDIGDFQDSYFKYTFINSVRFKFVKNYSYQLCMLEEYIGKCPIKLKEQLMRYRNEQIEYINHHLEHKDFWLITRLNEEDCLPNPKHWGGKKTRIYYMEWLGYNKNSKKVAKKAK